MYGFIGIQVNFALLGPLLLALRRVVGSNLGGDPDGVNEYGIMDSEEDPGRKRRREGNPSIHPSTLQFFFYRAITMMNLLHFLPARPGYAR